MKLELDYRVERIEIQINTKETKVTIVDNDTGEVFEGASKCDKHDNFNYETGVKIAFNKALKQLITTAINDKHIYKFEEEKNKN